MRFDRARRIADAILLEGYVLYPYRASATKNRWRWCFGILAPQPWSEAGGCEPWWMEAQVLVEAGARPPRLAGKLRYLQAGHRAVEALDGDGFRPVASLADGARDLVTWDEGTPREVEFAAELTPRAGAVIVPFEAPGGAVAEPVRTSAGALAGRTIRTARPVHGRIAVACEDAGAGLRRVRVRVENVGGWPAPGAPRDEALAASCLSAHLILGIEDGAFVSLLDPPESARAAARACRNVRSYPVLAGEPGARDLVLCAPIILYDHPRIAPESPGDLFDATEIDEILTLRTATLTEEEKREARGTDARAAELVARVDGLPPEALARLHGALRDVRGAEMVPRARWRPGDRVRLRPGVRRTDAQDLLYAGRIATVREVKEDVDGRTWLAVTIDDDPAAELHDWYGRYHHYEADEVEPLAAAEEVQP